MSNHVQISTLLHTDFLTVHEALGHHPPSGGNSLLNHVGCAIYPFYDFLRCTPTSDMYYATTIKVLNKNT
jgi:hypothetical protein